MDVGKSMILVGGDRHRRRALARDAFALYRESGADAAFFMPSGSDVPPAEVGYDAWAVLSAGKLAYETQIARNLKAGADVLVAMDWVGHGMMSDEFLSQPVLEACDTALESCRWMYATLVDAVGHTPESLAEVMRLL